MPIKISFNGDNCPEMPTMVLATKSGSKHGVINNITDVVLTDSMASPAELSFQVHKSLDGNPCVLWNELVDFKLIWCKEWDRWFSCEVSLSESGESVKSITAYSLGEYELSQILLFDVEINTEDDIARPDYTAPTIFYDPLHPDSSLLHRILSKAPHYTIGHVDSTIERLQRTFSFSNRSIKDCFDDVAEEIGCLFVYDTSGSGGTLSRSISVYDMEQTCLACGYRGEFTGVCPECGSDNIHDGYGTDTTVFVSTDNLTEEITYKVDAGSVKNCFRLTAGDELMTATVRACNPAGGSYIWYIPDSMRGDMSDELRTALGNYDNLNQYWTEEKPYELDSGLVSSYNTLVRKYSPVNDQLTEIVNPVTGYSALMRNYYDVIDFALFLQTTMMPEVRPESKTAASQAALLTRESLSPVAVSKLTESTSQATAESAIKTLVRAIVDTAKYSYTVNTTSWSNPNWTGTITITSRTEDDQGQIDTATTPSISLVFTDDFETYLRQLIDKKMKSKDTENFNISNVLSRSVNELVALLPRYSYDCLSSMANCCQDVLNVVIDVSGNQWADVQEDIYTPYYNKLAAIQSEMDLRAREVAVISDELGMGMQQNIESVRSVVQSALDLEDYLGNTLWTELCAYRREDEYSNQNYISDGLSNAELINNALDFIVKARKEIYKSATLQHTITATLSNLLSIPAFNPIVDNFSIGNWIRVRVDEAVYRLRLLSYTVDFSGFDSIQVEFSDVTQMLDGTSDVQNILSSASSMASTFGFVQKQASSGADSKNILSNWVENGLATTQARIVDTADNQNMVWDERGMLFRRYDPIMDDYDPEQLKIINSTIAVTDDNWRSTKTAVGRFFYQDPTSGQYTEAYGVNGETIVGKLILGENLGIYNTSGSLTFDQNGLAVSNSKNSITINPNGSSLFSIKKGQNDVFYFDSDGMLHIVGDGAGLDISGNTGLSKAIFDFRNDYITPLVSGIQTQIDGKIQTWYQGTDPSTDWSADDKPIHTGDLWYNTSNNKTQRWTGSAWAEQTVSSETSALIAQKAQVFVAQPTPPYQLKDLWFDGDKVLVCKTAKASGAAFAQADWERKDNYADFNWAKTQIDGKIQTWYQDSDPSEDTTGKWRMKNSAGQYIETESAANRRHIGDLWYVTRGPITHIQSEIHRTYYDPDGTSHTEVLYETISRTYNTGDTCRWSEASDGSGRFLWEIQDVPQEVFDKIDGKNNIFLSKPTIPYNIGDMWLISNNDIGDSENIPMTSEYASSHGITGGDLLSCIISQNINGAYSQSHWVKRNKYTDDTSLNTFLDDIYGPDIESIQEQIDGKIETWYQNADPSNDWTSAAIKTKHTGDLWYDTTSGSNITKRWDGTQWVEQAAPKEVFDAIDGKSNIFIAQPTVPYNLGDMWFITASDIGSGKAMTETYATSKGIVAGDILTCTTARSSSQSYSQSDWEKKNGYETTSGVNILIDNKKSSIRLSADALSWSATNSSLTSAGYLTVTGGTIGGFAVDSTAIHTANIAVTSNAQNSVALSSADFTRTINGTSRSGLRFAIGSNFGITNNGIMYASGGTFSGDVAATSFTINGSSLASVATTGNYNSLSGCPTPASTYITRIDGNGIKVHAENNTATNYVQINANGMDVVKAGSMIAHFGSNIRLGNASVISDSNESYLQLMDNSGIWGYKIGVNANSGELFFSLRDTTGEADNTQFLTVERGARPGAISINTDYSFYAYSLHAEDSIMEGHQYLENKYAPYSHTHSGYAASNHTHSGYAASNHTHSNYSNKLGISSKTISSLNVPAYDKVTASVSLSFSGSSVLGVIGHSFPDSSFMTLSRSYVSGSTYYYQAKNHNSSKYTGNLVVYFLCVMDS